MKAIVSGGLQQVADWNNLSPNFVVQIYRAILETIF